MEGQNRNSDYRARRVDANQPEIVKELRRLGCSVEHTHYYADGFPDIMVGISGFNILVEIKNGKKPPSKKRLTRCQTWWHRMWQGQVIVIENVEDARALVDGVRRFVRQIKACNISLPGSHCRKIK